MLKNNLVETLKSVLAAFIGVQSDKNRRKDFEQGSATRLIIAGLIFTVFFIFAIVFVVSLVLG